MKLTNTRPINWVFYGLFAAIFISMMFTQVDLASIDSISEWYPSLGAIIATAPLIAVAAYGYGLYKYFKLGTGKVVMYFSLVVTSLMVLIALISWIITPETTAKIIDDCRSAAQAAVTGTDASDDCVISGPSVSLEGLKYVMPFVDSETEKAAKALDATVAHKRRLELRAASAPRTTIVEREPNVIKATTPSRDKQFSQNPKIENAVIASFLAGDEVMFQGISGMCPQTSRSELFVAWPSGHTAKVEEGLNIRFKAARAGTAVFYNQKPGTTVWRSSC